MCRWSGFTAKVGQCAINDTGFTDVGSYPRSSGGFAHVYLVRTAEPVFNTTHHVLKRIAVASEALLNDVKKEVDIMVCLDL